MFWMKQNKRRQIAIFCTERKWNKDKSNIKNGFIIKSQSFCHNIHYIEYIHFIFMKKGKAKREKKTTNIECSIHLTWQNFSCYCCVSIAIVANLVTQMVNSCREFELKTILPFMVSNLIGHVSQHIVNILCAQMVVLFWHYLRNAINLKSEWTNTRSSVWIHQNVFETIEFQCSTQHNTLALRLLIVFSFFFVVVAYCVFVDDWNIWFNLFYLDSK